MQRLMVSPFDFSGGKSRIVTEKHEGSLSEKAHRVPRIEVIMVSSCELYCLTKKKMEKS